MQQVRIIHSYKIKAQCLSENK